MATLWVREYTSVGAAPSASNTGAGNIPAPAEPGTDQTVTFTTTTQSAAFASTTRFIRIVGSAAFHYVVGANPTATTSGMYAPANTPIDLAVTAGHKIAAVTAA